MNSLYPQIIVLLIVLVLLLWLLKKAVRIYYINIFVFFHLSILIAGFILDSSKTEACGNGCNLDKKLVPYSCCHDK